MTKPKTEKAEKKEKKPRTPKTKEVFVGSGLSHAEKARVFQSDLTQQDLAHQRHIDDLAFCTDKLITWAVNRHPDVPDVASYIQAKSRLT